MCVNFTAYRLNNSNCDHMQVVLTSEYTDAWQPTLSEHPNVSVVSYNTSGCGEMELRQQIRVAQRAMGLSGLRDIFGLPKHSELLLQDTELHLEIQVHCYNCTHQALVIRAAATKEKIVRVSRFCVKKCIETSNMYTNAAYVQQA